MSVKKPRKLKTGLAYWVVNRDGEGVQRYEVYTEKRDAERADARMKREMAAGTYRGRPTSATTVGSYAALWFPTLRNRTADDDRAWWDNHIAARCPWFLSLRLDDLDIGGAAHVIRLLDELRQPYEALQNGRKGQTVTLGEKTIFNIYSVLARLFKSARIAGLMRGNPCELDRTTKPTNKARSRRKPYTAADVETLTTDERIRPDARMWIALAFYTGMREGEICGRRFRDYDRAPEPLGALTVETQYDGVFLKTSTIVRGEKPRVIPVHPVLADALDAWWSEGFEMVFCRKPTAEDFIVPCRARKLRNHTRSSAYKMFITACELVGIESHTLHATRNTFISLCRRARCDVSALERVTHNASGDVIDVYTDYDWEPLCDAVSTFMTGPRPRPAPPALRVVASAGNPVQDVRPAKAQVGAYAPKNR